MRKFNGYKNVLFTMVLFLCNAAYYPQMPSSLKTGDIVFVRRNLEQTSKNNYDFVGVILIENKLPMVVYCDPTVNKCALKDLIGKSKKNDYDFKRVTDSELITDEIIATMKSYINAKINSKYDTVAFISPASIYNPEFVWKVIQTAVGISLCKPKEQKLEATGNRFINRRTVTIKDEYESDSLEQITD